MTDMRRGESILELDPSAQEEIDRGVAEDGSNLSGVSARCSWTEMGHLFPAGTDWILLLSTNDKFNLWFIMVGSNL